MFAVIYAFLLRPSRTPIRKNCLIQSRSTHTRQRSRSEHLDLSIGKSKAAASRPAFFNLRWNEIWNRRRHDGDAQDHVHHRQSFHIVGVEPIIGRNLTRADDEPGAPKVVLISGGFGEDFGCMQPLWETNPLDGTSRTSWGDAGGVSLPRKQIFGFPMACGFREERRSILALRSAIARLKPDSTVDQAQADMTDRDAARAAIPGYESRHRRGGGPVARSLDGRRPLLFALVAFRLRRCLLIACANVSQLLLGALHDARTRAPVRAPWGRRWRLARQVLAESALLAVLGSVAGAVRPSGWSICGGVDSDRTALLGRIDVNPGVSFFAVIVSCVTRCSPFAARVPGDPRAASPPC